MHYLLLIPTGVLHFLDRLSFSCSSCSSNGDLLSSCPRVLVCHRKIYCRRPRERTSAIMALCDLITLIFLSFFFCLVCSAVEVFLFDLPGCFSDCQAGAQKSKGRGFNARKARSIFSLTSASHSNLVKRGLQWLFVLLATP